jgi:hypothetical protein
MKIIRSEQGGGAAFVFQISPREKALLLATLKLYPMLDSGFHQISRGERPQKKAEQQWLEEAMAEQRKEHKKKLDQFFGDEGRFFKMAKSEVRLTLNPEQMEWMLRVLNEIRVGSWVQLGRPELHAVRKTGATSQHASSVAAMELSGYFQMVLLEAFQ